MEKRIESCVHKAEVGVGALFERISKLEYELDEARAEIKRLRFVEEKHLEVKRRKRRKKKILSI